MPSALATVSCTACGFWVAAQVTTLPSLNSATAAGGSMGACASMRRVVGRFVDLAAFGELRVDVADVARDAAGLLRGFEQLASCTRRNRSWRARRGPTRS